MNIPFESEEHRQFFYGYLKQMQKYDPSHQALFYTMGISEDTRATVGQWFDFVNDGIRPESLDASWQTGGTRRLTRLAFNLWNGFDDGSSTPYDLFDCGYGKYMVSGIQLRYPEYCLIQDRPKLEDKER